MNRFRGVAERPQASAPRARPDEASSRPDAGLPAALARELSDVSAALQAVCDRVTEQGDADTAADPAPVPPELLRAAWRAASSLDEDSDLGTWIADAEGRFLRVSASFAAAVGLPHDACLGLDWLACVIEEDRCSTRDSWLDAVRAARAWQADYGVRSSEGGVRYIRSRGAPVRDAAGRLLGWAGRHVDITERRRSEKQVQSLVTDLQQRVVEQTGRLWLMQDIAAAAHEPSGLAPLLRYALRRIAEHLHAAVGVVYLREEDEDRLAAAAVEVVNAGVAPIVDAWPTARLRFGPGQGLVGRVLEHGEPAWVADAARDEAYAADARQIARTGLRTALAIGVRARGRVVAVLELFFSDRRMIDEALRELLAHIGAQLGHAAERKAWERDLAEAIWRQQQRFSQDLHDGIGQELTGLAFLARSLQQRLDARELPEAESGETVAEGIQNILGQVRALARGLFPVEVDGRGLMSALTDLAAQTQQRCGLPCRFTCHQGVRVDDNDVATHLFRIAQEAINNAVKHARASELAIELAADPHELTLTVADDGVGMDPDESGDTGIGLRGMRHRAELIRAWLNIQSRDTGGTLVTCRLRKDTHDERE